MFACGEDGYASLTVERVLEHAGVSRASFYQYFTDIDDCFWDTYRAEAARFSDDLTAVAAHATGPENAVLGVLVDEFVSRRRSALMLMGECLAAGPVGLVERDRLIARIVDAMCLGRRRSATVDLPPVAFVGGCLRFLCLRAGERSAEELRDALFEWMGCYPLDATSRSWTERFTPHHHDGTQPARALARPVGPRGSARERILFATMSTLRDRGYRGTTVADIVAEAGVSRRLFYNEFRSRPAAVIAAYERGFERTLQACAPSFFGAGSWRERVWDSALAFSRFLASEPLVAHLGFVESFALPAQYASRVQSAQLAYTLFLEEGFRLSPRTEALSHSCAELVAAAIFELAFHASRMGPGDHLRRFQPLGVYVALAPFLGPDAAGAFVEGKLSASRASAVG